MADRVPAVTLSAAAVAEVLQVAEEDREMEAVLAAEEAEGKTAMVLVRQGMREDWQHLLAQEMEVLPLAQMQRAVAEVILEGRILLMLVVLVPQGEEMVLGLPAQARMRQPAPEARLGQEGVKVVMESGGLMVSLAATVTYSH